MGGKIWKKLGVIFGWKITQKKKIRAKSVDIRVATIRTDVERSMYNIYLFIALRCSQN